jgi:hypothetical protein
MNSFFGVGSTPDAKGAKTAKAGKPPKAAKSSAKSSAKPKASQSASSSSQFTPRKSQPAEDSRQGKSSLSHPSPSPSASQGQDDPQGRKRVRPKEVGVCMDLKQYADEEGLLPLRSSFADVRATLCTERFEKEDITEETQNIAEVLKTAAGTLKKIHTSIIAVQWKLKKRANLPDGALDVVNDFRCHVKAFWEICLAQISAEKNVNHNKVCQAMIALQQAEIAVSLHMRIFVYNEQVRDHMEMMRYNEVANLLRSDPSPLGIVSQETIQDLNMNIIEMGLVRLTRDCAQKLPEARDAAVAKVVLYLKSLSFMSSDPHCVSETFFEDARLLITALDNDDETSEGDVTAAMQVMKERSQQDTYDGLLTAVMMSDGYEHMLAAQVEHQQRKHKAQAVQGKTTAAQRLGNKIMNLEQKVTRKGETTTTNNT